ncbi:hypothetical protein C8R43DRAFT_958870 [Mycena crocata]|nr:hypothetical protein C8R43DRAFT_958870 [Mycena crocata]
MQDLDYSATRWSSTQFFNIRLYCGADDLTSAFAAEYLSLDVRKSITSGEFKFNVPRLESHHHGRMRHGLGILWRFMHELCRIIPYLSAETYLKLRTFLLMTARGSHWSNHSSMDWWSLAKGISTSDIEMNSIIFNHLTVMKLLILQTLVAAACICVAIPIGQEKDTSSDSGSPLLAFKVEPRFYYCYLDICAVAETDEVELNNTEAGASERSMSPVRQLTDKPEVEPWLNLAHDCRTEEIVRVQSSSILRLFVKYTIGHIAQSELKSEIAAVPPPERSRCLTRPKEAACTDPYGGLLDVFEAPVDIRSTRARVVNAEDETDLSAHEGSLSQLQLGDWDNVVAAGGAVLACLTPLSEEARVSKRSTRKYYHSAAYPTSDVDFFLWGMTPEQILAGFDVDAPCCTYDGARVYTNPRAIVATMRQCNTVDMSRRSPSCEVRLAKYAGRGFEVYVPGLRRGEVDPTIYERAITRITGLARLLVLEKLSSLDVRAAFLESRRSLRGRPENYRYNRRSRRRFKASRSRCNGTGNGDERLRRRGGPGGMRAGSISWFIRLTNIGSRDEFDVQPEEQRTALHRHPVFFGTIQECTEDCCQHCPAPIDEDEQKFQAEEGEGLIRGRISTLIQFSSRHTHSFIQEDPGRQMLSGSRPIDLYIGPIGRFFAAIVAHDRGAVAPMLTEETLDVNRRDPVGRTRLHVAILSRAVDIACDLVDAGARINARLVDGRTALHLAAQMDLVEVVGKLLERSAVNKEAMLKGVQEDEEKGKDDWSSAEDAVEDFDSGADEDEDDEDGNEDEAGEENEDEDFDSNRLPTAAMTSSRTILSFPTSWMLTLLNAGPDVKLVSRAKGSSHAFLPLALTVLSEDDERTCTIGEGLIHSGASCSAADPSMRTVFLRAMAANRSNLVSTFLRCDPNARAALDYPTVGWTGAITPLTTAVALDNYSVVAAMVAHGVDMTPSAELAQRAILAIIIFKSLVSAFFPVFPELAENLQY